MAKKIMKKLVCGMLTLTSLTACVTTATACETDNPKVQMTLTFNGEEYTLEYKLYKKVTPQTVKHFMALVEGKYYNGLCIHDYDASGEKMYTGVYEIAEDDSDADGLEYRDYYATVAGYKNFPKSVWLDQIEKDGKETGENPTYTLYGEFPANNFTVSGDGVLRQSYGSLTMYYYDKNTDAEVYTSFSNSKKAGQLALKEYKYNSATSQFYISLSTSTPKLRDYCTFAHLEDSSKDELEALEQAIADYIEEKYGDEEDAAAEFVTERTVQVDLNDKVYTKKNEQTFQVPNEPIVIKEMKVKSY